MSKFKNLNIRKITPIEKKLPKAKITCVKKNKENDEKKSNKPNKLISHSKKRFSTSLNEMRNFFTTKKLLRDGKAIPTERNYLWIVFFVKKFIQILKSRTIQTKLKKMQSYQENILCDLTFFGNEDTKRNKSTLNNPIYAIYVIFFFYFNFINDHKKLKKMPERQKKRDN